MFAIIKTGGKQYRVAANDVLTVEKLTGAAGDTVTFAEVLMIGGEAPVIGDPLVAGASVSARIVEQKRARKIIVFKKKRRKKYRRTKGHRQYQTVVRVTDIVGAGDKPKPVEVADRVVKGQEKASAPNETTKSDPASDDLSLISGVGPVIVKKLNEAGYTQFQQIANLSQDEMAALDENLDLQGRSAREEWIEQARELVAGKAPRAKIDQKAAEAAGVETSGGKDGD